MWGVIRTATPNRKETLRKYNESEKGLAVRGRFFKSLDNDPDKKEAYRLRRIEANRRHLKKLKATNPQKLKQRNRRSRLRLFGLTPEAFDAMLEKQGGVCAICGKKRGQMSVDHNHETGRVRGILCQPCNSGIGMLGDNIVGLEHALRYMRETT